MNAFDDEWHKETECRMVGGPCDGDVRPMKRGWSEYVVKNDHRAMGENLGDSIRQLMRKEAVGEIRSEEDLEEHFDEQRERDEQDGVKFPPGGHKYRRGENGPTFMYVGPVSVEEAHRWSMKNVIPHPSKYANKAMWERSYAKFIDGDDSEGE